MEVIIVILLLAVVAIIYITPEAHFHWHRVKSSCDFGCCAMLSLIASANHCLLRRARNVRRILSSEGKPEFIQELNMIIKESNHQAKKWCTVQVGN